MAVVINHVDVDAKPDDGAAPRAAAPAAAPATLDPDDFIAQYGTLLRDFIRDEIERHLRNLAD